ncbi:MAG: hypothetical protein AB7D57_03765 [Desulfovibrionaceae bacterium]
MPLPNDASDSEIQARLAELEVQAGEFEAEKARVRAQELDLRAQEDPAAHVSFAREIFELQQRQRVLEVEIDLARKKIRRLQLGYAEDAAPSAQPPDGFLF